MEGYEEVMSRLFQSERFERLDGELKELDEEVSDLEKKWKGLRSRDKKLVSRSASGDLKKKVGKTLDSSAMSEIVKSLTDVFRNPEVETTKGHVDKILHITKARIRDEKRADLHESISEMAEGDLADLRRILHEIEEELDQRHRPVRTALAKSIEGEPHILVERRKLSSEWGELSNLDDEMKEILEVWAKSGGLPQESLSEVFERAGTYSEKNITDTIGCVRDATNDLLAVMDSVKESSSCIHKELSTRIHSSLKLSFRALNDLHERMAPTVGTAERIEKILLQINPIMAFIEGCLKGKSETSGSDTLDRQAMRLGKRIARTKKLDALLKAIEDFHGDHTEFIRQKNDEFSDTHMRVRDILETFGNQPEFKRFKSKKIPSFEPNLFSRDTLPAIKKLKRLSRLYKEMQTVLSERWSPETVSLFEEIQERGEISYDHQKTAQIEEMASAIPLVLKRKGT